MLKSLKHRITKAVDKATRSGKVYIFLTSSGGYFSTMVFILFVISLSYGNSLAYLSCFFFLSVIWISCIVTNFNLYDLNLLQIKHDDYYLEGYDIALRILFKNKGIKTRFDIEGRCLKSSSGMVSEVKGGEVSELELKLPINKPGIYSVKKIDLRTSFPFGLFRSWKPLLVNTEILVVPKLKKVEISRYESIISSGAKRRLRSQSEEFLEHSRYSNQDISRVDWKIYARSDQLFLKEFDGAVTETYDFDDSLNKNELSYGLIEAQRQGASYSLKINGNFIASSQGREHLLYCLREVVRS